MDLADYLAIIRRHWLGTLLITILVGAAAFGVSIIQPKVYEASATGFVGTGDSDATMGAVNDQLARSRATSYVDIASSRATAIGAIQALGLKTTPSELVGRISVRQPLNTVLIKISARADSPVAAQRLADAWVVSLAAEVRKIEAPSGGTIKPGTPRIVPIEAANLPTRPVSPKVERNTGLGLLVGALLGLGYAVLRRSLDRRLSNPAEIEALVDTPVVGVIPVSPSFKEERPLESADSRIVMEEFRKLRSNLVYMDVDDPPRTLVITSPHAGDGKSTVASNLAIALARSGELVVLVDADLRRPRLAERFGLESTVGLVTVLAGRVSLPDAVQPVANERGLSILASGPIPPNPSEILGSKAMQAVIQQLSASAFVIIDAPPLLPVTDAAVVSRATDGALVVVSAQRTLDTELKTALDNLASVGAQTRGVIMNRLRPSRFGGGAYGYGYGYGYSSFGRHEEPSSKGKGGSRGSRRRRA